MAGFSLTLVTIHGVPRIADAAGWHWALPWPAAGPLLGVLAMLRLRYKELAARLAGGLG